VGLEVEGMKGKYEGLMKAMEKKEKRKDGRKDC
jgi:hypothetical protein